MIASLKVPGGGAYHGRRPESTRCQEGRAYIQFMTGVERNVLQCLVEHRSLTSPCLLFAAVFATIHFCLMPCGHGRGVCIALQDRYTTSHGLLHRRLKPIFLTLVIVAQLLFGRQEERSGNAPAARDQRFGTHATARLVFIGDNAALMSALPLHKGHRKKSAYESAPVNLEPTWLRMFIEVPCAMMPRRAGQIARTGKNSPGLWPEAC